ncbi:MAG: Uma2 family endonuclease [Verrucomicrobiales bacterium]|nr:Uma2 family endonuclease [Verrucomicrobiales bacterium]
MTVAEAARKASPSGPQVWPLDVKAYHALGELGLIPERTELLYGQIIRKMSKSPFHSYLHQSLSELLQAALPPGTYCRSEQPLTGHDSEPEPDLAVVRGARGDYRHEHPRTAELVIEVCVSSHEYDRSKLRAYASAGVKECWLVLAPEQQVEVHLQPQEGQYTETRLHGPGGSVTSTTVPRFTVDLTRLFAS